MHRLAACTIASKSHLALGRVVAGTFLRHHPEIPFFLLLADEVDGRFDPKGEPYRLIRLEQLGIPGLAAMEFHYAQQELSYALTPYIVDHLLDRGFSGVVFIKQESMVVDSMAPALSELERHSVLLTPHLLAPLSGEDAVEREENILLAGTYNGGFLAFSDAPEARRFLAWWKARAFRHCVHAVAEGMHYEQRWLDFALAFVEDVHVVRDPGMNVGHWNLPEREVRLDGEAILIDGVPCRLFRFSGFDPERPDAATRYFPRLTMSNMGPAAAVFRRYLDLLEQAGYRETKTWPYAWDRFKNGVPIPVLARRIFREMGDEAARFGNPFHPRRGRFFRWLKEPAADTPPGCPPVSRLWQAVYESRPDVREAFPDHVGRDRAAFLNWAVTSGAREHGIPDAFWPCGPARAPSTSRLGRWFLRWV